MSIRRIIISISKEEFIELCEKVFKDVERYINFLANRKRIPDEDKHKYLTFIGSLINDVVTAIITKHPDDSYKYVLDVCKERDCSYLDESMVRVLALFVYNQAVNYINELIRAKIYRQDFKIQELDFF